MRLVVATGNPGKLAEFADALAGAGIEALGASALDPGPEVEETGASFEANARLKAEACSLRTELPVVADDSGLEVDALGGAPGVLSARYGGPGLDDRGRVRRLLADLDGVPDALRTARFRCVLAVARAGVVVAVFEGAVEGRIAHAPSGDRGFGYDPVFFHDPIGCTFGEIDRARKQALSHRGAAIAKMLAALRDGRLTP